MMKKNILIIAYAYPPNNVAGARRPYALTKYFDKNKYKITVITCQNPDLPTGISENFNPDIGGVELIKIKSKIGNSASNLRTLASESKEKKTPFVKFKFLLFRIGQQLVFPDKAMFWSPNVKAYLKKNKDLIQNAEVVFSTSPGVTNHKIARFIKRENPDIQWIADFRDFNFVENWEGEKGIKAGLHKKLETSIIKEANNLTFVTQTMQKAYQQFYPKYAQKMHFVYNGLDRDDLQSVSGNSEKSTKISFFYAGSFYGGLRSPFPLMELLDKSISENRITKEELLVQIAGNLDEEMRAALKKFKSYDSIDFLGNLPRKEVLKHMSQASFLWLIVANVKAHYQTVPIKLFEYIAARRPIVNFAPIHSESSEIIRENKLGYNFNTLDFNLEDSYHQFEELISGFRRGDYSQPLPNDNLTLFSWENQIRLIEGLIEN